MGLALAIDYTLLMFSRFRDELADGMSRDDALARTMAAAGRTVLFDAVADCAVRPTTAERARFVTACDLLRETRARPV